MSSSVRSTHDDGSSKAESTAVAMTRSVTDGALANSKPVTPDKATPPVRRKTRQRYLGKTKADSETPASVTISSSKSSTTQSTQTEEKVESARIPDANVPRAAKGAAAADFPAKQGDLELARPTAPREENPSVDMRCIVKALLVPLVIMVAVGLIVFLQTHGQIKRDRFCTTKGCEEHKNRIETQLDKSVDPCDDFRAYVCGGWASRKEFRLSRSQMSDMHLAWLYKLPKTLDSGVAHFPIGRKVDAMFKSCVTPGKSQVNVMKEFMKERGMLWPEKPPEDVDPAMVLFDLSFNWNVQLWFTLKVLPAIPGKVKRRIFFMLNDLIVFWKNVWNMIPPQYNYGHYTTVFKMFANDTSNVPDAQRGALTIQTVNYVFNTLAPSCPCKARIPSLFRLGDIDNITSLLKGARIRDMFNAVLGISPPVALDELVLLNDLSLLKNVETILRHFNDTVLLRHVSYLFVYTYAAVAYPLGFMLVLHGSEARAKQELPRFCAGQIEPSFKLLVAAMASVTHFSEEERRHVVEHLDHIVEVSA
ncbi:hypothetical protein HPB51_027182 [Rhipicephalus microplus]|uniref:Peptidase M13 N-terminal domain-containing protein n=1 Tax=Rhipicephalus microplus TaxID=6941 RepID=A0A9J6D0S5_RHIMP|nr:hypothetical protein HPB51_027182 [Rhipicephalus microplus]